MSAAKLRTIIYSGNLYRADPNMGDLNENHIHENSPLHKRKRMNRNRVAQTANKHYKTLTRKNNPLVRQEHQFFTMSDAEVSPYRQKGTTYTKEWEAEDLLLLDIMDLNTRKHLATLFSQEDADALDIAFPIVNGVVYRKSNDETVLQDRAVIDAIGRLRPIHEGKIDGYYMKKQTVIIPSHNITPFHSEVGVCRHAFPKLHLLYTTMHTKASNAPTKVNPPSRFNMTRKNMSRKNKNNNNNNNNNNTNKPKVRRALF